MDLEDLLQVPQKIFHYRGDFELAKELAEYCLKQAVLQKRTKPLLQALVSKCTLLFSNGNFDAAIRSIERALEICNDHDLEDELPMVYNSGSIAYYMSGNMVKSLEYAEKNLQLSTKLGNQYHLATAHHAYAWVYLLQGKVKLARKHADLVMSIAKREKGVSVPWFVPHIHKIFEILYHRSNNPEQAFKEFEMAIKLSQSEEPQLWRVWHEFWSLFFAIKATLDFGEEDRRKKYLDRIRALNRQMKSRNTTYVFALRLIDALILLQSKKARERFKAQEILEELVEDEVLVFLSEMAFKHLIELYIDEYKLTNEESDLAMSTNLINQFENKARSQPNDYLLAQTYALRAHLNLIDNQFTSARNHLSKALSIAESNDLNYLGEQLTSSLGQLELILEDLEKAMTASEDLKEELEWNSFLNYIKDAQKFLNC